MVTRRPSEASTPKVAILFFISEQNSRLEHERKLSNKCLVLILVACTQLYKPLMVGWSVCLSYFALLILFLVTCTRLFTSRCRSVGLSASDSLVFFYIKHIFFWAEPLKEIEITAVPDPHRGTKGTCLGPRASGGPAGPSHGAFRYWKKREKGRKRKIG